LKGAWFRDGGQANQVFDATPTKAQFGDGASDRVFNHAWDFTSNTAYRFDSDWTNPLALFKLTDPIPARAALDGFACDRRPPSRQGRALHP
jgi:hypothetical protein